MAAVSKARLGERDRALLDFERDWHRHQGCKATAIRQHFGISPARYYQLLARLRDRPEAQDYDPLTVRRLRRRARRGRAAGSDPRAGRLS